MAGMYPMLQVLFSYNLGHLLTIAIQVARLIEPALSL